MKFLFVGAFLFGSMALGQDLNFQEYRKFLMQGNGTSKKLAIQTTCTTPDGQVHRIGEKDYDTCLGAVKAQQGQKQVTGKDSGTTIHFGN